MIILAPKKANISLIMIFVLAIWSVIGLMSTSFIQDMLNSTRQLREFYGSYYAAKWGIELWHLMVNRYEYGFESTISGEEDIIKSNLECSSRSCAVAINIVSRFHNINPQTTYLTKTLEQREDLINIQDQQFTLQPGESIIFPLFMDNRSFGSALNTQQQIINLLGDNQYSFSFFSQNQQTPLWLWITLGSEFQKQYDAQSSTGKQQLYITWTIADINLTTLLDNTTSINGEETRSIRSSFYKNFSPDEDYYNYLYLTNLDKEQEFTFLLQLKKNNKLVADQSIVSSLAQRWSTDLWLQALIKKPLLEYIVRPYSE